MTSYLCKSAGVSRSGYYNYFSLKSQESRKQRNNKDEEIKEIILNAYNFKGVKREPGKVLLTDITYLFYGNGKKAYLSTVKDSSTNEILAYNVSEGLELDIVIDTIHKLKENKRVKLTKDTFIHSDQGTHVRQEVV